MKKQNSILTTLPVLFGFFVMGFCDIVGISSDYVQRSFNWSPVMTGFVPSMVFIWFLFLSIPIGNQMNKWGRKNTVLISMGITIIGMILPLLAYDSITCMTAYALLGIGNAILQVSLNPLLNNVVTNKAFLTSSLTAGQVIKAVSSLVGPEIVLLAVNYFGADKWLSLIHIYSVDDCYLQDVSLNGKQQETVLLPFEEVVKGGRLTLKLDSFPNKRLTH